MNKPKQGEPKTLAQFAAEAAAGAVADPWACRQCGCYDWRVSDSRQRGQVRMRQRVCRNCGEPMTTIELPVR